MSAWDRLAYALLEGRLRPAIGYGAIVLAIAVGTAALTCSGCGPGAIGAHARAALVVTHATGAAGEAVDAARGVALDRVEAAHPERGPLRSLALDEEASRWRPAGQALDATRSALLAWVSAIALADAAGDDGSEVLAGLLPLAARVVALYAQLAALAAELGAEGVPTLPPAVRGLLGGVQ